MKCVYCGAEIKSGQIFCPSCGKEVQLVSAQSVLEDDFLNDFLDEDEPKRSRGRRKASYQAVVPAGTGTGSSRQQRRLVVVSLCVMVFVLAVVAFLAWFLVYNTRANSLSYQLEQGRKDAAAGENESAVSHYQRALRLERGSVEARIALGKIYYAQGDYDSAQVMYQEAVNLDGSSIEAYKGLMQVFEQKKQYDKITEAGASISDPAVIDALADYLIDPPVFSIPGGAYDNEVILELASENGDTIYYTIDGKDPIQYGSIYSEPFSFSLDGSYLVSAVCVNSRGIYSVAAEEEYEVSLKAPDMPVVTPEGGSFGALTYVSISVPDNCSAYYTWDGSDPDITSKKYTAPFSIPSGANVLSVILVDERTEKVSPIYRNSYTYYEQ